MLKPPPPAPDSHILRAEQSAAATKRAAAIRFDLTERPGAEHGARWQARCSECGARFYSQRRSEIAAVSLPDHRDRHRTTWTTTRNPDDLPARFYDVIDRHRDANGLPITTGHTGIQITTGHGLPAATLGLLWIVTRTNRKRITAVPAWLPWGHPAAAPRQCQASDLARHGTRPAPQADPGMLDLAV